MLGIRIRDLPKLCYCNLLKLLCRGRTISNSCYQVIITVGGLINPLVEKDFIEMIVIDALNVRNHLF